MRLDSGAGFQPANPLSSGTLYASSRGRVPLNGRIAPGRTKMRMRDMIMLSLGFVFGIMTAWFVVASLA